MPSLCQSRSTSGSMRVSVMATPRSRCGKRAKRIEHHAIVVDVRVALHHETVGEAEMVEERDQALDRRVGRRVAASRLVGEFVGRSENVEVRNPRRRAAAARAAASAAATGPAMRGGSLAVFMLSPA